MAPFAYASSLCDNASEFPPAPNEPLHFPGVHFSLGRRSQLVHIVT